MLTVLACAKRIETVFDGKRTVWHLWGEGRPVVLLHGGSGSWTHWIRNVLPLSEAGFQAVVPDIPGFGESDVAATGGHDAPGVVPALAYGLGEILPAGLLPIVGFSFGAMVATLLAKLYPAIAGRLVLVAPPALGLRNRGLTLQPWRQAGSLEKAFAIHQANLRLQMLYRLESANELAVKLHWANLRADRMRQRRMHLTEVVLETLPQLQCRVDAIFGAEDALYKAQMGSVGKLLKSAPEFGELMILPRAGHWIQFEEAVAFNTALLRLLA